MEGAQQGGAGVEHPEAHPLTGPCRQRLLDVLEGDPVEDGQVRGLGDHLGGVGGTALRAQVDLGVDEQVLVVHLRQGGWVDNDGPVHAAGQVEAHGHGRAVVQPDAAALGGEGVDQALTGADGAHGRVRGDHARVEVQGVAHGPVVDQGDLEGVPHLSTQDRRRDLPVVGHAGLGDPTAHGHGDLGDGEGVAVGGLGGRGRQGGVEGGEALRQGRLVVGYGAGGRARARTGRRHGGGSRGDVEDHAVGTVPGDRAPALHRPPNDARVELGTLSRGHPAGGGAVLQDQVVDHVGGVVQGDDQAVPGGDVHGVGHEPHARDGDRGLHHPAGGRYGLIDRGPPGLGAQGDDAPDGDGRPGGHEAQDHPTPVHLPKALLLQGGGLTAGRALVPGLAYRGRSAGGRCGPGGHRAAGWRRRPAGTGTGATCRGATSRTAGRGGAGATSAIGRAGTGATDATCRAGAGAIGHRAGATSRTAGRGGTGARRRCRPWSTGVGLVLVTHGGP